MKAKKMKMNHTISQNDTGEQPFSEDTRSPVAGARGHQCGPRSTCTASSIPGDAVAADGGVGPRARRLECGRSNGQTNPEGSLGQGRHRRPGRPGRPPNLAVLGVVPPEVLS